MYNNRTRTPQPHTPRRAMSWDTSVRKKSFADLIGRYRRTDNDHAYDRTFGTDNEAVNADDNGHHVKFAPTVARLAESEEEDEDLAEHESIPLRQMISMKATSLAAAIMPGYRKQRKLNSAEGGLLRGRARQRSMSLGRAARDGLVDLVQTQLKEGEVAINDDDEDGFSALHHASRYNRVGVVRMLIDAGADPNICGPDDCRPLHLACRYNSAQAVQFLLAQGADVNAKDSKGKTPLHYATRRGNDMATKMLLGVATCDVNAADYDHTTPLHMAAVQGNANIVELLISRGAKIGCRDINDMTVLMWASAEGHVETIHVILKATQKHGPHPKTFIWSHDNEGCTALHIACQNGHLKHNMQSSLHLAATQGFVDIAKMLIQAGADVDKRDKDFMTPVHRAARFNRIAVIDLLMKHGANLNAKDKKGKMPLHAACWQGQTEAVQFLLDNGAQVDEADASMMTPLHWAAQYNHYDTLMLLLKHSGTNLIEKTDTNDQTVLHYAAHTGNCLILKTLLSMGAKTDVRDQEERSPLHMAAQYDNVSCVEALVACSNQEINDDDVEGRTPLLLASTNGNAQVVQVLLSLGADITCRDDEHCTALQLAAAKGHTLVLRILLDNHASLNDVDKLKNTALHYACAGGYTEAVLMLLDERADLTLLNTYEYAPIDLAVDNQHNDLTCAMMKHKTWRDCVSIRNKNGIPVFDKVIAKLPTAAMIVLDHCVERSSRDDEDANLTMTFDYSFIDPGPGDPACQKKRYFALNTMVSHGRDRLLSHPLCQNCLLQKWVRFGRPIFYMNLTIYIGYLISLTTYVALMMKEMPIKTREYQLPFDHVHHCPVVLNEKEKNNKTLQMYFLKHGRLDHPGLKIDSYVVIVTGGFLAFFIALFMCRELFKLVQEGWRYFFNPYSIIACCLITSTVTFLAHPPDRVPCLIHWRAGWIAMFLAWINFIMYLRRIDFCGLYVIMFVAVLVSLLKAVLVYFFFCLAFAGSFFVIMSSQPSTSIFGTIGTSLVNIFVMTLGEIEFQDVFVDAELGPFTADAYLLLAVFLFLMPIVLMNLMIGIAVGDIEKILRNAYLKRIALQVELLYHLDNTMPKMFQHSVHVRRAVIKPNEVQSTLLQKVRKLVQRLVFGSSGDVQFIHAEKKDKFTATVDMLREEMNTQKEKMKTMQTTLQSQSEMLMQICAKLNVGEAAGALGAAGDVGLSLYDNDSWASLRGASPRPGGLSPRNESPSGSRRNTGRSLRRQQSSDEECAAFPVELLDSPEE